MPTPKTAILLIDCPDRKGIVVTIVNFLVERCDRQVRLLFSSAPPRSYAILKSSGAQKVKRGRREMR